MNTTVLTGDVGDEQEHVGGNCSETPKGSLPIPVPEYGEDGCLNTHCIDCGDSLRGGERVQCDHCAGVEDLFIYDMQQITDNRETCKAEVCYSYDEELYRSDFQEILDEFADTKEIGEQVTYWQGETSPYTHASFLNIDRLVEDMQEAACDEAYEDLSEGYLDDLTDEAKRELEKLILDFLNKKAAQPTFYSVKNVEPITGWWDGEDVTQIPMMTADEVSNLVD